MNKTKNNNHIKLMTNLFKKWINIFNLNSWNIRLFFNDDDIKSDDSWEVLMSVFPRWEYLSADIHINIKATIKQNKETLEPHVVHELVHILLNEINLPVDDRTEESTKHTERVTSAITNIIYKIYNNKPKQRRKKNEKTLEDSS